MSGASTQRYVFVSGPPRAGTTLLELVLSSHPQVTISPECHFLHQFLRRRPPAQKPLSRRGLEKLLRLINDDAKLRTWPNFDVASFMAELSSAASLTAAEVLDRLFRRYAACTGGGSAVLGNKRGTYAEGLGPYVKRVLPRAKFLLIVRDPRDVIRSMISNLGCPTIQDAAQVCAGRALYMKALAARYPTDTLVVRFEDLVVRPHEECRRICGFLDLDYSESMLHFWKSPRERLIGATRHIHPHTRTPFNPELALQWQRSQAFTSEQLSCIESISCNYMELYGYAASQSRADAPHARSRYNARVRAALNVVSRHFSRRLS